MSAFTEGQILAIAGLHKRLVDLFDYAQVNITYTDETKKSSEYKTPQKTTDKSALTAASVANLFSGAETIKYEVKKNNQIIYSLDFDKKSMDVFIIKDKQQSEQSLTENKLYTFIKNKNAELNSQLKEKVAKAEQEALTRSRKSTAIGTDSDSESDSEHELSAYFLIARQLGFGMNLEDKPNKTKQSEGHIATVKPFKPFKLKPGENMEDAIKKHKSIAENLRKQIENKAPSIPKELKAKTKLHTQYATNVNREEQIKTLEDRNLSERVTTFRLQSKNLQADDYAKGLQKEITQLKKELKTAQDTIAVQEKTLGVKAAVRPHKQTEDWRPVTLEDQIDALHEQLDVAQKTITDLTTRKKQAPPLPLMPADRKTYDKPLPKAPETQRAAGVPPPRPPGKGKT